MWWKHHRSRDSSLTVQIPGHCTIPTARGSISQCGKTNGKTSAGVYHENVTKDMREGYYNKGTPHPVHVITSEQYKEVKNNTILVTGMECFKDQHVPQDGIVMFHEIEHVGRNVKKEFDNQQNVHKFSTDRILRGYVAVVIRSQELTEIKDIQLVGKPTWEIKDSYAVLLIISNHRGQHRHRDNEWTTSVLGAFNEIRHNLVKQ